jgi:hypothetical protein
MQALQLDEQRSMTTPTLPDAESDEMGVAIRYLTGLSESLWLSARSVSSARSLLALDGATPGAIRIRRARQAAAIQSAVQVLAELVREQLPVATAAR